MSPECLAEIQWWVSNLTRYGRIPIRPRPLDGRMDGYIFLGASDSGVGAVLFAEGQEAASSLVEALRLRAPPGISLKEVTRQARQGLKFVAALPADML